MLGGTRSVTRSACLPDRQVDPLGRPGKVARPGPVMVRSSFKEDPRVRSIIPEEVDTTLGGTPGVAGLAHRLLPIIAESTSTLVFTNTRAMGGTMWYHQLLDRTPGWPAPSRCTMARWTATCAKWVEEAPDDGRLKAVVCTSSLDLGVDFRPWRPWCRSAAPKGVARSCNAPGAAVTGRTPSAASGSCPRTRWNWWRPPPCARPPSSIEARQPLMRCFDVLAQYLVTLTVGDGFDPATTFRESVAPTASRTSTGMGLAAHLHHHRRERAQQAYEEFQKAVKDGDEDGTIRVHDRRTAMRHRLSIGTIVSDAGFAVKYVGGGTHRHRGMNGSSTSCGRGCVLVRQGGRWSSCPGEGAHRLRAPQPRAEGKDPSWQGGRMPLSSFMARVLRAQFTASADGAVDERGAAHPGAAAGNEHRAPPRTNC